MIRNVTMVVLILVLAGFAATGFAYKGYGKTASCGNTGSACPASGGDETTLTEEDLQILADAKKTYIEETSEVRDLAYQKYGEIQDELKMDHPDTEKVAMLQDELSEMLAEIDQARLNYMIATKGIIPAQGNSGGSAGSACSSGNECSGTSEGCSRVK